MMCIKLNVTYQQWHTFSNSSQCINVNKCFASVCTFREKQFIFCKYGRESSQSESCIPAFSLVQLVSVFHLKTRKVYRFFFSAVSFFSFFFLKDNCFTEFCCFLSNINMNQPQVYIYPLPFEPRSYLPPHSTPLG